MIGVKTGKVIKILKSNTYTTDVLVKINDIDYKAINYNRLTGSVEVGDLLLLNTTAIDLRLGTGGYHFVMSNLDKPNREITEGGHIMKLRYSPYQVKVFAAEEQESKYHDLFNDFESLNHMPVIVGTLHSMLPPIVEVLKTYNKDIKVGYIMTDGAALPMDLSNSVRDLKERGLVDATITIGNAFGGDLDCVNIYNGLIAAKEILKCDVCVVTMGPGIVGTGTKYGFTGIEQGHIIDAVNDLGGIPIAVPRISFKDQRERHKGMSHHSMTVFGKISKTKAVIPIPDFEETKKQYICEQIDHHGISKKHKIIYVNLDEVTKILEKSTIKMSTMGRKFDEEKEYFITAGVAAELCTKILSDAQSEILL